MADSYTEDGAPTELTVVDEGLYGGVDDGFDFDEELLGDEDAELIVEPEPVQLPRTMVLDPNGGLMMTGRGPALVRGDANLRGWVQKCLLTHEGAHPIHPAGYGVETPLIEYVGFEPDESELGEMAEVIREALTFHPLISDIDNFTVTIDETDDSAYAEIRFDILKSDGSREEFDMNLETAGGVL